MAEALRVILLVALAAAALTTAALILAWWIEQVVLRLMFGDARHPEFELALWDATLPVQTSSPGEALRLGRRWLSHLEALLKG